MSEDKNETKEFCQKCHIGSLHSSRAVYAHWHDGQFVVVPGLPAWRCDYCGDSVYDSAALMRLILLLGPESDLEIQPQWRASGLEGNQERGLGDRRRVE